MARRHARERGSRNSQRSWGWLVIALGVAATSAQADTLTVPDPYPTIQSAIDAAVPRWPEAAPRRLPLAFALLSPGSVCVH